MPENTRMDCSTKSSLHSCYLSPMSLTLVTLFFLTLNISFQPSSDSFIHTNTTYRLYKHVNITCTNVSFSAFDTVSLVTGRAYCLHHISSWFSSATSGGRTSGYTTMVHGRGCNPHRCTTTFANVEITTLLRHNSETIRDRKKRRPHRRMKSSELSNGENRIALRQLLQNRKLRH